MPRFDDERPEWENDPEAPDESDWTADDDEEADDATCPACGATVYRDAERCATCGDYIIPTIRTTRTARRIGWVAVSVIAILVFVASLIWCMR